jgi:hypothetical protein
MHERVWPPRPARPTTPAQLAAPLGSARSFGAGSTGGTMFWTRPGASVGVGVRRRSPFWGRPVDTAEPTMLLGGDSYRLVGRTSLGLRAALRSGLPRPGWCWVAAHSRGRNPCESRKVARTEAGFCGRRSSNASMGVHARAYFEAAPHLGSGQDRIGLAGIYRAGLLLDYVYVRDRATASQ